LKRVDPGRIGGHVWQRPRRAGASNDVAAFRAQLSALVGGTGWQAVELGPVLGQPLPLLMRSAAMPAAPRLLIAAGFHGEEPAGPWGVLRFLRSAPRALLAGAHLSLLPLVNATGFAAGRRYNDRMHNPNRGYGPDASAERPSAEGRALMRAAARLRVCAADGLLACHEDIDSESAYVYGYEPLARPGAFSRALRDELARHFPLPDAPMIYGDPVRGGIIFNRPDGSFEAWLSHAGARVAACIETPGRAPFAARVRAQAAVIQAFVAQRIGRKTP
jgi:predicted deacylase